MLAPIRQAGALRLSGVLGEATVPLSRVTTDVREAVDGADVIVVAVPAFAQEPFALAMAPFLAGGQVVVLTPGATGGALTFAATLRDVGVAGGVIIAETLSLPYACRKAARITCT